MTGFKYKTVRCEWQIVSQPVGQYGENDGAAAVLWSWPTYEEAAADMPNHGYQHQYVKDRWLPKNFSGNEELRIRYKEVEITA